MSVPVGDHQAAVRALLGTASVRRLPLEQCHGLVLAEDIPAAISLPPFDNSAMDGYAVRASDVADAQEAGPVQLSVEADIPAGRTDIPELDPHTAHRIMTGAPIPRGADTVVRVEDTDGATERVTISAAPEKGAHIRRAGEDIAQGTVALGSATVLGTAQLGLASGLGLATLAVYAPPTVLVVSTGTELVTPPATLRDGQIYESNSVMLATALRSLGCRVDVLRSVDDDVETFTAELAHRMDGIDLVVTSGGVSAGAYEVVKDALTGEHVTFSAVAMQPGGPQGCGTLNGVPIVTLPGNPVSVLVSYEVFLRPALRAMLGYTETSRPTARARLRGSLQAPPGKRQYRRGYYSEPTTTPTGSSTEVGKDAALGTVEPRGGPGSHLLGAFTRANCLIVIDEDTTELAGDTEVDVLLLS